MYAMEPIDTHEYPLAHEPIEDWQNVARASAEQLDRTASTGKSEAAVSAEEPGGPVTAGYAELGTIAGADYGLWEMSAGAMRDIEGEEIFLVISGTGRIEFDEPRHETVALAPGALVRLEDGVRTRWYIDAEPLRKLFIVPHED